METHGLAQNMTHNYFGGRKWWWR